MRMANTCDVTDFSDLSLSGQTETRKFKSVPNITNLNFASPKKVRFPRRTLRKSQEYTSTGRSLIRRSLSCGDLRANSKSNKEVSLNSSNVTEYSTPIKSNERTQTEEELTEQTKLYRRKSAEVSVQNAILLNSLRSVKKQNDKLSASDQSRLLESASRKILHTLLLNSWRKSQKENSKLRESDAKISNQIEQLQMHVKITRSLLNSEKDKTARLAKELEVHATEMKNALKEIEALRREKCDLMAQVTKYQTKFNNMHGEKLDVESRYSVCQVECKELEKNLTSERKRLTKCKEDLCIAQSQINDLLVETSRQQTQLTSTERQRLESEKYIIDLKQTVETYEVQIENLKMNLKNVTDAKLKLQKEVERLEVDTCSLKAELQVMFDRNKCLDGKVKTIDQQLSYRTQSCCDLEASLSKVRLENSELKNQLLAKEIEDTSRKNPWREFMTQTILVSLYIVKNIASALFALPFPTDVSRS